MHKNNYPLRKKGNQESAIPSKPQIRQKDDSRSSKIRLRNKHGSLLLEVISDLEKSHFGCVVTMKACWWKNSVENWEKEKWKQ